MQSPQWIEQSHSIMTARGFLFAGGTLLLIAIYYWLHRRGTATRVPAWSAAKFGSRPEGRFLSKLPGWVLAAAVLLLPLGLVSLATRLATRELYYYFGALEPDRLGWVGSNYLSWAGDFILVVLLGGAYAALDAHFRQPERVPSKPSSPKTPRNNRLTRFVAAVSAFIRAVRTSRAVTWCASTRLFKLAARFATAVMRLRERAACSAPYRLWTRAAAVFTLLTFMHLLTSIDLLPDKARREPLPDSPTKEAILALAKDENLAQLDLRIKHAPNYMNAWATHVDRGAKIEFTDTLWNGQSEKVILAITGHELYHVFVVDPFTLITLGGTSLAMLIFFVIGAPRKVAPTGYNLFARLPVYVIIFVAAWPAFQAGRCAVLRPYEGRADFVGVQALVQRKLISPEDAKAALIKMHQTNRTDPDPAWLSKLFFYDHPTLDERLRNIDEAVRGLAVESARK